MTTLPDTPFSVPLTAQDSTPVIFRSTESGGLLPQSAADFIASLPQESQMHFVNDMAALFASHTHELDASIRATFTGLLDRARHTTQRHVETLMATITHLYCSMPGLMYGQTPPSWPLADLRIDTQAAHSAKSRMRSA